MEPRTRRQKTIAREIALATAELERERAWWAQKAQDLQRVVDEQNFQLAELLGVTVYRTPQPDA